MCSASSGAPLLAGLAHRHRLLQRGHAVQVRVYRDEGIEQAGQKVAHDALAHGLTGRKGHVLAHVGQVGRHQREVASPQGAGRARGQQQLHQFFVGRLQAAPQRHALGQAGRQAQLELAIGEAVARDGGERQAPGLGGALGDLGLVVEGQQEIGHAQNSTNTWGTSLATPMRYPLARSQAWRAKARSAG